MSINNISNNITFNFFLKQIEKISILIAIGFFAYSIYYVSENAYIAEIKVENNPYNRYEKYLTKAAIKNLRNNFQFKEMQNFKIIEDDIYSKKRKNPFNRSF